MPRKDLYHHIVVDALIKDDWLVTDDPLHLSYGGRNLYVDLGAEEDVVGAEKAGRKIAVEIKSFISESDIHDFELGLGQYRLYRNILAETDAERALYLAVPVRAYEGIFREPLGQLILRREELSLIVFDENQKRIHEWIP